MAVLDQLGLNQSFFIQLIIFSIAYLALSNIVFAPYIKALSVREEKTKGGEDLAFEFQQKAQDLRTRYEVKARQVSGDVKTIFDEYRQQATQEYEKIVSKARGESQVLIESTRKKVSMEIEAAQAQLKAEIPIVAQEMTRKLLA